MTKTLKKLTPISIVVLALLTAVAPLSIDTYLAALPEISQDLGTTASRAQLTLTAFMVGLGLGQIIIGPLSDKIGRLRPLYVGVVICFLATLACVFVPSVELFIAARFIMGLFGSFGLVLARAIISDSTKGLQTARLMGIMMMINGFAPILAPLIGGVVLSVATWRAIFGLLAIFMVLSAIAVFLVIKESLPAEKRRTGSVFSAYRGLFEVIKIRRYRGFMFTMVLTFGAFFGYISGSTYVLQNVFGLSQQQFILVYGINSLGIVATSSLVTYLVGKIAQRLMLTVGIIALVLASGTLTVLFALGIVSLWPTLILLFLTTCSVGFVMGNAPALALVQARHLAGSTSATMGAIQFVVGGLASPLVALGGDQAVMPMALTMLGFALLAALAFFTTPVEYGDWTKEGAEYHSHGGPKTGEMPVVEQ